MRALSIRQPYAELILRGIKTVEYRSQPTRIIGERFHIYASRKKVSPPIVSDNLQTGRPPEWMLELAEQIKLIPPEVLTAGLPTGVIVGTAVIERVTQVGDMYRWHLGGVERAKTLRKPKGHPQPVWFRA
jgi:predicted transcriptional regulator